MSPTGLGSATNVAPVPGPAPGGYPGVQPRRQFRRDVQGLRALAVLLVIACHAGIPGLAAGYMGVDVFFVISGCVITQLLLRESAKDLWQGLGDFYARRIRRIVPAATAMLVLTVVAGVLVPGARLDSGLLGDVRWASVFAANLRFIETGSDYFVAGVHRSLIMQFWSLGVEEQFYLLFPLVVFLIARTGTAEQRLRRLSFVVGIGVGLSALWSLHISAVEPVRAYYSPLTRFWEFGLGCLLATLSVRRPPRPLWSERLAVALGMALLAVAAIVLQSHVPYPGWLAWLPCGATGLLLWAGADGGRTPITWLLSTRPLVYIGDISYSLYLTHYVWLMLPRRLAAPPSGWAWLLIEVAGTVLTAVLSYHLIENPIRRSQRLAADGVAMVLLLCVCVASAWTVTFVAIHFPR